MGQPDLLLVNFPLFDPESAQVVAAGVAVWRRFSIWTLQELDGSESVLFSGLLDCSPTLFTFTASLALVLFLIPLFCWDDSFCFLS